MPRPPSLLDGVNVAWSDGPGIEDWDRDSGRRARRLLTLLRLSGATQTRVPVRWADIERVRGRYEWSHLDQLTAALKAQGLAIVGVVRSAPDWAVDTSPATRRVFAAAGLAQRLNDQPPTATAYPDWIRFAAALGGRYKNRIQHWEVGYHPDSDGMPTVLPGHGTSEASVQSSGDPAVYTRLLKLFTQSIKRSDSACMVSVGALSTRRAEFLSGLYGNGGRGAFDAVALSLSGSPGGLDVSSIDACRQVLVTRGDAAKGLWISDWGWPSYPEDPAGLDPGHQAKLLRAGLAAMRKRPYIQQADWKALVDAGAHSGETEGDLGFGLCTQAGQSKIAFSTFQKEAVSGLANIGRPDRTVLAAGAQDEPDEALVHVDLDAAGSAGALPALWLGSQAEAPFPVDWEPISRTIKARSSGWIRLNPFQTGWIRRSEGNEWAIDHAGLDRLLRSLSAGGISVIMQVSATPGMNVQQRAALVRELAQHYGTGANYSIYRWEFVGQGEDSLSEYPAFAQALAVVAAERPVGFASTSSDPIRDAEGVAKLCSQQKFPLNSFSWLAQGSPVEASRVMRGIRDALALYPSLKGTMLLPSVAGTSSGPVILSRAQRLIDYGPLEQPHGLLGILAPLSETVERAGELTPSGRFLSLLNRLHGVRLPVYSDETSVRCLAAKGGDTVQVLVWREGGGQTPISWSLRMRGLPRASAIRVEQYSESGGSPRGSGAGQRTGADSLETPDAVSDIPTPAGEADALLRLEPGTACLVTMRIGKPAPLRIALSTPRPQWFAGEFVDVDCEVRNTGRSARKVDLDLTGSPGAAVSPLRTSLGTVQPGAIRRVRFRAHIAAEQAGPAQINVRATGDVRASLAVRVVPAVSATLVAPRYDVDSAGIARVRIQLSNISHAPIPVKIRLASRPDGLLQEVTVPPEGRVIEQTLAVSAPAKDAGCYPVEITLEGLNGRLGVVMPLIGVPLECRYASLKPAIDGDLSEWTAADTVGMGRADQVRDKVWRGPTDLSAYAYLQWDEQFLYVACAVTDDVFLASFPPAEMRKGDSVLFAVSTNRRIPATPVGYGPADHEFGMALLDGAHPVLYRFAGPTDTSVGLLKRGAVAARRVGTRTFYEAAIPWAELGKMRPAEGTLFGFAMRVNDSDGQAVGYIMWTEGMSGERRPLLFPPVKLVR